MALAVLLLPLLGFVALVVDIGRLYVNKAELQSAADSCALAAAQDLAGAPHISQAAFDSAASNGAAVAVLNRVDFQSTELADPAVMFNTALHGAGWQTAASHPNGNARYVRCTVTRAGMQTWFMGLFSINTVSMNAEATAMLPSATDNNCARPPGTLPSSYCGSVPSLLR